MMPSVAELTYFFEVTNTLNLSRAAKNLNISQPSLTRSIQNLEATIGTDLLVRHKKGVELTRAGKKLILQIKPLLECWQNTKLAARASHQLVEGQIKIGCHTTVGLFIHRFISEIVENYPNLDIEICNDISDIITQQVIDINIDIGIVTNPIMHPDLIIRKIGETEITLWTGDGNRKAQDLNSNEAVIICNPNFHNTQLYFQKCRIEKLKFKRILKVNTVEVIASLAANNCGIGLLPSCISQGLYAGKLTRVSKVPVVSDDLYLIYRKEYVNVQVIKTVVAAIKKWTKSC